MEKIKLVYQNNRTVLKDVLPLKVPMCISIEPTNLCNFKCTMCFHGNNEYAEEAKPLKNMDMDCFRKAVSDIKELVEESGEKIKIVKLYSLGEPLIHPEICEMIKEIKEAEICKEIEITSNGSLLTKEIAEKMVDYGLDILRISIYSVYEEKNREITKSCVGVDTIRDNIMYLRKYRDEKSAVKPVIIAKMFESFGDENRDFMNMYEKIADRVGVDELYQLNSVEKDVFENIYQDKAKYAKENFKSNNLYKERKVCRYPFTHVTVRNDGTVISCCSDWLKELKIGDIKKNSLKEIWESRTLYNLRCEMLENKGINIEACKHCEIPYRDSIEDNIDDFPVEKISYKYNV